MARARTGWIATRVGGAMLLAATALPLATSSGAGALPNTSSPTLSLARTIRTTPFTGTSSAMRDGEGSAFVPNDPAHPNIGGTDSLWLSEDNGHAVWEINPYTGALKSSIQDSTWQATKQYSATTGTGTGASAGSSRVPDLESMAYDRATDTMYVFNGKCCKASVLPTAFRLTRGTDGTFHPEAWQALPAGSDYTAAAWHPGDHKLYVGVGSNIRTYDFATNVSGSTFGVSGLSGIYGMTFSDDGNDLLVARSSVKVSRVNWNTKSVMAGWTFDMKPFGMRDARAIELINDQLYVLDGYDSRPNGDPLRYAVFVFNVCCGASNPPVVSFSSNQAATPDLTLQFTDTSTNSPNAWTWDFDNNGTVDSTAQNPTHTFPSSGDFLVRHTASNSGGAGTAVTQSVHVNPPGPPAPPVANFTAAKAPTPPFTMNFTDTSTGAPTSWAWDFDNDSTPDSTSQNPSHTFPAEGDYPVTLTATNAGGPHSVTKTVQVTATGGPVTATIVGDAYVSASSATKNYGAYTDLKLLGPNGVYQYRPYFQFSVSGLSGAPSSAVLRLYVTDGSDSGGSWYSTASTWTEGTINWSNAPALVASPIATVGAVANGQWVEIDVTGQLSADGTYSFSASSLSTNTLTFASRETANAPQLIVMP